MYARYYTTASRGIATSDWGTEAGNMTRLFMKKTTERPSGRPRSTRGKAASDWRRCLGEEDFEFQIYFLVLIFFFLNVEGILVLVMF